MSGKGEHENNDYQGSTSGKIIDVHYLTLQTTKWQ